MLLGTGFWRCQSIVGLKIFGVRYIFHPVLAHRVRNVDSDCCIRHKVLLYKGYFGLRCIAHYDGLFITTVYFLQKMYAFFQDLLSLIEL